jgi:antitoxin (DNA-binding transcriptional repressor) of toxin-antitoxin stability system
MTGRKVGGGTGLPSVLEIHELPYALARVYNLNIGKHVIHISEEEAAVTNVATLLAHVRAGSEVIIENGMRPVAVLHPAEPVHRTISECIALLPEDSTATVDPDFARDVAAAARGHREPLNPPTWD